MAPFVDAAAAIDRTNFDNTFISYYTWGEAIALGLDLTLRERTDGDVTLDDFMRALWQQFGKPGGRAPGYVDDPTRWTTRKPSSAAVAGDAAFADDFFRALHPGPRGRRLCTAARGRRARVCGRVVRRPGFAGQLRLQDSSRRRSHYRRGAVRLAGLSQPASTVTMSLRVGRRDARHARGEQVRGRDRARKPGDAVLVTYRASRPAGSR